MSSPAGRESGPAGLHDGAHAGSSDGGRDDVVEPLVVRGHAAEPDEHRGRTGAEEVDQQVRGRHPGGLAGHQYPVTCTVAGQSAGGGTTSGL